MRPSPLRRTCDRCGRDWSLDARFCGRCGAHLRRPTSRGRPRRAARLLESSGVVAVVAAALVAVVVGVGWMAGDGDRDAPDVAARGEVALATPSTDGPPGLPASADGTGAQVAAPRRCVLAVGTPVDCVRWRTELGAVAPGQALANRGSVYAVSEDRTPRVVAVAAGDGHVRWTSVIDPAWRLAGVGRLAVVLTSPDGEIVVIDARNGRTRWLSRPSSRPLDVAAVQPWLHVTDGSRIWSYGEVTGALAWTASATVDGSTLVGEAGAFLVEPGRLTMLHANTGAPRWSVATDGAVTRVVDGPGILLAVSGDGHVHGIDPASGEARWRSPGLGEPRAVEIDAERASAVVSTRGRITSLSLVDGEVRWSVVDPATQRPLGVVGSSAVYTSRFGRTVALDPDDGSVRWFSATRSGHEVQTERGGEVLVSARALSALDAVSGVETWRLRLGQPVGRPARLVGEDPLLVVTQDAVLALDPPGAG